MPTNVVILYGQDACNRISDLLGNWDHFMQPAQWGGFVFLLACPEMPRLRLSDALKQAVNGRVWHLPGLEPEAAPAVAEQLLTHPNDGGVRVHCVCSDFPRLPAPVEALIAFIDALRRVVMIDLHSVYYLILSTDAPDHNAQRAFIATLEEKQENEYVYLLSTTDCNHKIWPCSFVWNALYGELYANGLNLRHLTRGLYSLGYAALNANGSELDDLTRHLYRKRVLLESIERFRESAGALTWTLITGEAGAPGPGEADLAAGLRRWMASLAAKHLEYPDPVKVRNSRILCAVYDGEPRDAIPSIRAFYELNAGLLDVRRIAREWMQAKEEQLACRVEAAALSGDMLNRIIAGLEALGKNRRNFPQVTLPHKRWLESNADYRDRCCSIIEAACRDHVAARTTAAFAAAFAEALRPLPEKAPRFNAASGLVGDQLLPAATEEQLRTKYRLFTEAVENAARPHVSELLPASRRDAPLFAPDGTPSRAGWETAVGEAAPRIRRFLTKQFSGSFYQTLQVEYATNGAMDSFMDQYLSAGARLFFSNRQPALHVPLYFLSEELDENPLFAQKTTIFGGNDNAERIDQYAMDGATLSEYLDPDNTLNPYFEAQPNPASPSSRSRPAAGSAPAAPTGKPGIFRPVEFYDAAGPAGPFADVPSCAGSSAACRVPEEDAESAHELRLSPAGDAYLLSWDWHDNVNTALVSLSQGGNILLSHYPVACAAYNSAGHALNVSRLIAGPLPYGYLCAEIFDGNGQRYASARVLGRRDELNYHFQTEPDGKQCLSIRKGEALSLGELVLRVTGADEKVTLYPLRANPTRRYPGLMLEQTADLATSPLQPYPTILPKRV